MKVDKMKDVAQTRKFKSEGGNLAPPYDSEKGREMQKKGLEVRRANKERREMMADVIKDMGELTAVELLEIEMKAAYALGQTQKALELAEKLAPYQTPKLAAKQLTIEEVNLKDLSDEELNALAEELEEDDG